MLFGLSEEPLERQIHVSGKLDPKTIQSASQQTSTSAALSKFLHAKRLLLSGTPLQNNLDEFFSVLSFLNPGLFRGINWNELYKKPILKSREKTCKPDAKKLGDMRLSELNKRTKAFMLRRTSSGT